MGGCRDQAAAFSRVEMMMTLTKEAAENGQIEENSPGKAIGFAPKMHVEFNKNKGAKNDSKVFGLNKWQRGGKMRGTRGRAQV